MNFKQKWHQLQKKFRRKLSVKPFTRSMMGPRNLSKRPSIFRPMNEIKSFRNNENKGEGSSFLRKSFYSMVILAAILIVNLLPNPTALHITSWVQSVISTNIEFDDWANFGEVRRVSEALVAPVLSGFVYEPENLDGSFLFPAEGDIIENFEIQGDSVLEGGILIEAKDQLIHSAKGGTVSNIIASETFGHIIYIDHGDGYFTVYDLVRESRVEIGDVVTTYEEIGIADRFFYYKILKDGTPIDYQSVQK